MSSSDLPRGPGAPQGLLHDQLHDQRAPQGLLHYRLAGSRTGYHTGVHPSANYSRTQSCHKANRGLS
eukprot:8912810-Pyramimonas_sp.AAC.1